ncbi:MAG: PorV/PorQ family protein [Elusimicrobiota bacterium]
MKKFVIFAAVFFALFSPGSVFGAGSSAAQFLQIQPGARASAVGGAYVSLADDGDSLYWNSAGLAQIDKSHIKLFQMVYLEGLNYSFISYSEPMGKWGVFSLGMLGLYSDKIEKTLENDYGYIVKTQQTYNTLETAFKLGWGKSINSDLNIGITGKIINQRIDQKTATGVGIDLGGKYFLTDNITLGANIQHLGFSVKGNNMPVNFKLGAHWQVPVPDHEALKDLIVTSEINQPVDGIASMGIGLERKIYDILYLRTGYNSRAQTGGLSGLRGGLGIDWRRFKVDYSYAPYGDLGNTHQFTFGATF